MSRVKKAIPESFKERWHEWRAEVKDVEKEELGDNHFSEDVEKLGWGVQEAQERHRADASKSETTLQTQPLQSRSFSSLGCRCFNFRLKKVQEKKKKLGVM